VERDYKRRAADVRYQAVFRELDLPRFRGQFSVFVSQLSSRTAFDLTT
jgi:hypothetical protein